MVSRFERQIQYGQTFQSSTASIEMYLLTLRLNRDVESEPGSTEIEKDVLSTKSKSRVTTQSIGIL